MRTLATSNPPDRTCRFYESAIIANNPVAYYRLNETSGTSAFDYWGGFPGTYGAAATMGVAGPQPPAFAGFEANFPWKPFAAMVVLFLLARWARVFKLAFLVVAIGLPSGLALFGLAAGGVIMVPGPPLVASLPELALIAAVSTVTAVIMAKVRVPGGILFGAMAGSALLHGTDLVHAVLPWWLGASAVVILGAVVGARFANSTL